METASPKNKTSFSLRKIKLSRRTVTSLLIHVGIPLALFLIFLLPTFVHYKRLTGAVHKVQSDIDFSKLKIAQINQLHINKQNFLDEIQSLEKRMLSDDEVTGIVGRLSELCKEQDLKLIGSRPLANPLGFKVDPNAMFIPHFFEIHLEGGYHKLGIFLSELRNYHRLVQLNYLEIEPNKDNEAEHSILVKVAVYSRNASVSGSQNVSAVMRTIAPVVGAAK